MAKAMGFNGVRKYQKLEDPRFLYWADRMGLLVSSEMTNAYMFDGESVGSVTREWIRQTRLQSPQHHHLGPAERELGRAERPRCPPEGAQQGDLFAVHDYSRTGDLFYERFKTVREGKMPVPFQAKMFHAPGFQYNGSPIFLSEFGGISYVPLRPMCPTILGATKAWSAPYDRRPKFEVEAVRAIIVLLK